MKYPAASSSILSFRKNPYDQDHLKLSENNKKESPPPPASISRM